MCNHTAWNTLMDISRLVDASLGLAILADYDCADSLCIPEELEAARNAPMAAAKVLLAQAKELLDNLEPVISKLEREAA
jgi:hypothetical protein